MALFLFMNRDLEHKRVVLEQKIATLNVQKLRELELNDELKARRSSKDDPDFVEMSLMQMLGCVPEGYKKIVFIPTAPK
jgi:hypothetical protein